MGTSHSPRSANATTSISTSTSTRRLSLCSERVAAAVDRAEAVVAGAGGEALYHPKY